MKTKWKFQIVFALLAALFMNLESEPRANAQSVSGTFTQAGAGGYHTCVLQSDGNVSCWGANWSGQAPATRAGPFTQIDGGWGHTCALKTDGTVDCWGTNQSDFYSYAGDEWIEDTFQGTPVAGTFTQISAGAYHNCGVKSDGNVYCWGWNEDGQLNAPAGSFTQVSAGLFHSCGVKSDGTLACWGGNQGPDPLWMSWYYGRETYGQATPPADAATPGTYKQVSAGKYHTCAVRTNGTLVCWGLNDNGQRTPPDNAATPGTYKEVTAGDYHNCAIRTDGQVACWGSNANGRAPYIWAGPFKNITAGRDHTCGVKEDGSLHCWGLNDYEKAPPSNEIAFASISAGQWHTCAARGNGSVACWGDDGGTGRMKPPTDAVFKQISAGSWHSCGIQTNGTIDCWGSEDGGRISAAPTGTFTQISVADWHGCGLRTNGQIDCWGLQDGGRTDDPSGTFLQVSSANWHNCAVKSDHTVTCWGIEANGRRTPPSGYLFNEVSSADWHTCGVTTNGYAVCWGNNDAGRVSPVPAMETGNPFTHVSVGNWHSCALRQNGSIVCWGSDDDGRVTSAPTSGVFTQIEAGDRHTCALREDGYWICWGNNGAGQAPQNPDLPPAPDIDPPSVRVRLTPAGADGANGWYRSPVLVETQAFDLSSEVIGLRCSLHPPASPATFEELPKAYCPFLDGRLVDADGSYTVYAAAVDLYGNKSEVISRSFQIDSTPPTLTCPTAGPFRLGSGDQPVGPAGVDAGVSGLDEAASTLSGAVPTGVVGPKVLTFTALDLAGNFASLECSYNVIYDFGGFYPPLEPAPALNLAVSGSAIPLKFSLAGAQGLEILAEGFPTTQQVACDTLEPMGEPSTTRPAGKSGLSYDPLTGWYNYVWKAGKGLAGTCQALTIELIDGTQNLAYFQFQ